MELQVERILVVAGLLEDKLAKETQRWLVIHRILRHQRQKYLVLARSATHALLQLFDEIRLTRNAAKVEEYIRVHERLLLRHGNPALEILLPLVE